MQQSLKHWAFVLLLSALGIAQDSPSFGSSGCTKTEDTVGIRYTLELEEQGRRTTLSVPLTLTNSPADSITFSPLVFLDTEQLPTDQAVSIACGEQHTFSYTLPGEPHALNVLFRDLPMVPPYLEGLTYEQAIETYLSQLKRASWNHMGQGNEILRPLPPEGLSERRDELALASATILQPSKLFDNYLYAPPVWEEPVAVASVEEVYSFGVFYQSASEEPRDITITCLLNDQQFAAFEEGAAWGGTLEPDQAVRIEGRVKVVDPGWHLLRCVLLNGVLGNEPDPTPDTILSTYLYKAL